MVVFQYGFNTADYPEGRKSLSFTEKVIAFRDSYRKWHFDIALNVVTSNPDAGFAVLCILNPYFEIIGRHYEGLTAEEARHRTGELTKFGIQKVFPNLTDDNILDKLHTSLRCSVAHIGLTGYGILLNGEYNDPITLEGNEIDPIFVISPTLWAMTLYQHFNFYISQLLDENNNQMRKNFEGSYTEGV